jgi:hypothetical protein
MAHRSPPAPPDRLAALIARTEERLHAAHACAVRAEEICLEAREAVIRSRQRLQQRQERQPAEPGSAEGSLRNARSRREAP